MRLDLGEPVGTFEVKSGKLVVSDPCYDRYTWCMGTLENVKNGTWEAYVFIKDEGVWGNRVARLTVFHTDHSEIRGSESFGTNAPFEVGVDSGQAGFFDDATYPTGARGDDGEFNKDAFYDECCHGTGLSDGVPASIIRGAGVVSSSGFGDGGYECTYYTVGGQVVAAEIVFIGDEPEEDDEDEVEDDEDLEADEVEAMEEK